jgi:hypothetical protein
MEKRIPPDRIGTSGRFVQDDKLRLDAESG